MAGLHQQILLGILGGTIGLIVLTLLIPVCFRACYNRFRCCRTCCKCAKPKRKVEADWSIGEADGAEGGHREDHYHIYFEPSLVAQIFVFLCVGFIFVTISGLTDVPFYFIWILFFLVWSALYIDFLRRRTQTIRDASTVALKGLSDGEEDAFLEDVFVSDSYEKTFKAKVLRYIRTTISTVRNHKIKILVALLAIFAISGISTASSSCMCIAANPIEVSTLLSRHFAHKYCVPGQVCNVAFTLANAESDLIMNFHASEQPDTAYVAYDVISHPRDTHTSVDDWIAEYKLYTKASTYKMNTVKELKRWVNWADITNLEPETYYYFVAVYTYNGVTIASNEYKVRTLPANGNYSFITGGDMSTDGDAEKLIKHAADSNPHFAIIGGDNAYDNGFKACYLRWDEWFDRWNRLMTINGSYIPIMLTIGNHEAGRFGASIGDDPYYTPYYPQQIGLSTDMSKRMPYHSHRLGADTNIIVLDSNVIVRMDGDQLTWLEAQLAVPSKVKIVVYHGNIYPSANIYPAGSTGAIIGDMGKKYWVPLFEKYNVTVVFENHLHLYKRTKPLRNDKVDIDGITYFGDGAWGVLPNIVPLSDRFYIEKVSRTQHFFHVSVQNNRDITVDAIDRSGRPFDSWNKQLL